MPRLDMKYRDTLHSGNHFVHITCATLTVQATSESQTPLNELVRSKKDKVKQLLIVGKLEISQAWLADAMSLKVLEKLIISLLSVERVEGKAFDWRYRSVNGLEFSLYQH
ncbi:hypothetical protein NEOLI_000595 [Neolecta irregularis DAH-3]|uniref:Uncharacterized protein n=1 Tax=Neolecta irregularis (strain DAH-3) TaxID=1198029 RepID=A0A1U7LRJ6_NEOID|nr:hypothetical protein NEOLI_000595 [Neolecta irregularis DAH-3]|eukprot:OLL25141.1 hypothetical protein NEOLI_000595 [Neolecta irregularis DAH-3]